MWRCNASQRLIARWMMAAASAALLVGTGFSTGAVAADAQPLALRLRTRSTDQQGIERVSYVDETWDPSKTAVIVCDMWDAHHCLNAVRRVGELTPRMNAFLHAARDRGATIIHAPSDCMDYYRGHPARVRAQNVPRADQLPEGIDSWCNWKDEREEKLGYPIDHSDGGEDDDMNEHWRWHAMLAAAGRNPAAPWKRQTEGLDILEQDYITDNGVESWNILTALGIDHVMLVGVHTNMCVLGRPFGLRQLAKNGKRVVLVRDLTDTMYNPDREPYVSHFSGTDLVVEHVERNVCPTITSDQLLGGKEFRFAGDRRPHIVLMIGEDEYETERTLPEFARRFLQRDFRLSFVHADPDDPNSFPGIEVLDQADVLMVSVRRRTPPADQLRRVRDFLAAGKPAVGIRTASHAFVLRDNQTPPEGHASWLEFDAMIWGGNYHGHYGASPAGQPATRVQVAPERHREPSPLLTNVSLDERPVASWLYKTRPLASTADVLMVGRHQAAAGTATGAAGGDAGASEFEPVAWTLVRADGGRSFYTSLGHPDEFRNDPSFQRLLLNATYWAAGLPVPPAMPQVERMAVQDR